MPFTLLEFRGARGGRRFGAFTCSFEGFMGLLSWA